MNSLYIFALFITSRAPSGDSLSLSSSRAHSIAPPHYRRRITRGANLEYEFVTFRHLFIISILFVHEHSFPIALKTFFRV